MSLEAKQAMLARLYTDSSLRARLRANPRNLGEEVELDMDSWLRELSHEEIAYFARSLVRKRFNAVRELLPLSFAAFGARFGEMFRHHAEAYAPTGIHKHWDDAIRFAGFLETGLSPADDWLRAILRYESMNLAMLHSSSRVRVGWFAYPVHRLTDSLATKPWTLPKRWTVIVLFRRRRQGDLRRILFSMPGNPTRKLSSILA